MQALDQFDSRQLKKFIEPFETDGLKESDLSEDEEDFVAMINAISDRQTKLNKIADRLLQYTQIDPLM